MYKFYDVDKIISIQQVRSNTVANFKINISCENHEYQVFKGARRAATEKDQAFKAAEYWKSQYLELEESLYKDSEN